MVDNFVFYKSWLDIIEDNYPDDIGKQMELIHNIVLYGIRGERNETVEKMFTQQVFAQIDMAKTKHEKRSAAGKKGGQVSKGGGAPKGNQNAKSKTTSKQQANNNSNINMNNNKHINIDISADGSRLDAEPPSQEEEKKLVKKINEGTGEIYYVYANE